jgi:hypothetical protein
MTTSPTDGGGGEPPTKRTGDIRGQNGANETNVDPNGDFLMENEHQRLNINKWRVQLPIKKTKSGTTVELRPHMSALLTILKTVEPNTVFLATENSTAPVIQATHEIPANDKIYNYAADLTTTNKHATFYLRVQSPCRLTTYKEDPKIFKWLSEKSIFLRLHSHTSNNVTSIGFIANMHPRLHNRTHVTDIIKKHLNDDIDFILIPRMIFTGKDETRTSATAVTIEVPIEQATNARDKMIKAFDAVTKEFQSNIYFVLTPHHGSGMTQAAYRHHMEIHLGTQHNMFSVKITGIKNIDATFGTTGHNLSPTIDPEQTIRDVLMLAEDNDKNRIFSSIQDFGDDGTGTHMLLTTWGKRGAAYACIDRITDHINSTRSSETIKKFGLIHRTNVTRAHKHEGSSITNTYAKALCAASDKANATPNTTTPQVNAWTQNKRRRGPPPIINIESDAEFPPIEGSNTSDDATEVTGNTGTLTPGSTKTQLDSFRAEIQKEMSEMMEVKLKEFKKEIQQTIQSEFTQFLQQAMTEAIGTAMSAVMSTLTTELRTLRDEIASLQPTPPPNPNRHTNNDTITTTSDTHRTQTNPRANHPEGATTPDTVSPDIQMAEPESPDGVWITALRRH